MRAHRGVRDAGCRYAQRLLLVLINGLADSDAEMFCFEIMRFGLHFPAPLFSSSPNPTQPLAFPSYPRPQCISSHCIPSLHPPILHVCRSLNECPRLTDLLQATKDVVKSVKATTGGADWSPSAFPQSQACERRESFDRWAPLPDPLELS